MSEKKTSRLDTWLKTAVDEPKFRTKEVWIESVGSPNETEYGFCQAIEILWGEGYPDTINCFWTDTAFSVPEGFSGKIKMRTRWMGEYWKGELADPLPPEEDWAKVSTDRQTMIVRQSSVRSACEYYKHKQGGQDGSLGEAMVLEFAKKIENYVMTGKI
jgi:hypothetical protein